MAEVTEHETHVPSTSLISHPEHHVRSERSQFHFGRRPRPLPKEIVFKPDLPFTRNYSLWFFGALSLLVSTSAFGYAWSATSAHDWVGRIIWSNPQNTIFTINLLSHLTGLFLDGLITRASDNLRWRLCCRRQGIKLLDFMTLSGSTSFWGLARVLVSLPSEKATARKGVVAMLRRNSYRLWSTVRYLSRYGLICTLKTNDQIITPCS